MQTGIRAIPPGAEPDDIQLDEAIRQKTIDAISEKLTEYYVYPDVAPKMVQAIRDHQKHGDYRSMTDGFEFADTLATDLTFSGGEEFTFDLQRQKRATIVGETMGGGGHPVEGLPAGDHFSIGVPFGRAINPVTHGDWEGKGVEPDVKVGAADALATPEKLAADKLAGLESPATGH
jgi:hypothetical protein